MNLNVFILDDEQHAIETLSNYVLKTPLLTLAGAATNPLIALKDLCGANPPDLLLLDVDMPEMSGLDLAGLISKDISVVFVTSYREYGVEAFALSAVDYLLKPISYARFFSAVQKVAQHRAKQTVKEQDHFFVKGDEKDKFIRVDLGDINYIAAAQNYVEIFVANQRIITYLTLGEILVQLPPGEFCQIHKSYIVSRTRIAVLEKDQLLLTNGKLLPVGQTFNKRFLEWLSPKVIVSKRH